MSRRLRSYHNHIYVFRRNQRSEVDRESMTEQQGLSFPQVRPHLFLINFRDPEIRRREKDYIGLLSRFRAVLRIASLGIGEQK